jgi:hypothetical protein
MKTKMKNLTVLIFLSMLTLIGCEKEDDKPDVKDPIIENPKDTIKPTPTVKQNTILIGNELIGATGFGFASGQAAANLNANSSNAKDIRFFFSNADTQNGLNEPAEGVYTFIESTSGLVTESGKVNMRINVNSSVYSFYMTTTAGGTLEIKKIDGYTHYIFNNVKMMQYTSIGSPLVPAEINVSGNLGGDPHLGVENGVAPSSMQYVFNSTVTTITSTRISTGSSNYVDINNGEIYIYFKSNLGVPPPGDYTVIGSLANTFAYESSKIQQGLDCLIAYYKDGHYSIASGVKLKVELVNGKTRITTNNVLMNQSSRDTPPFFPLSINVDAQ